MQAGLVLSSLLGLIATFSGQLTLADAFSEHAMRRNVAALVSDGSIKELLSYGELQILLRAAREASLEEVDQLLARNAHIQISINPEARITARRTEAIASPTECSKPSTWLIRIINEGYVTAPLYVGVSASSAPTKAVIAQDRLTGATVEYRLMRLIVSSARPQEEIAIAFSLGSRSSNTGVLAELPVLSTCKP